MAWTVSVVSLIVFASAALLSVVGVLALRERPDPMAWPLAALMFIAALWAIPHALSFGFTSLDQIVFWNRMVYPWASLVPVIYFVLSLTYAGYDRWLSWRVYAGLCLIPAITLVMVWTNPGHNLFWDSYTLTRIGEASVLDTTPGPWFWIHLLYSYLLVALAFGVFASVVVHSSSIYRKQALLIVGGGVVPTLLNIMFNLGVGPLPVIDFTTSALALSGVAFAVALFRYDLLGLSPAAYRSVPELFGDGILIFDDEYRLREVNDPAERILDTTLERGKPAVELFDSPVESLDGSLLTSADDRSRSYSLRYRSLSNQRGDTVGHVLVMREITALKEHEQRLSVTNRILRHNLRNELNVILLECDQLDQLLEDETSRESLDRLKSAAERLGDVGEKARHFRASLSLGDDTPLEIDLVSPVKMTVERYRSQYPDAEITLDAPAEKTVLAGGTTALEAVLDNIIENALEHTDRSEPQVDIEIEETEGMVAVRVTDDGPGIPETEREVLTNTEETQLQHGSSFGLWLTYWFVTAMDGELEFTENEPRGTTVTVRFRKPEEGKSSRQTGSRRQAQPFRTD